MLMAETTMPPSFALRSAEGFVIPEGSDVFAALGDVCFHPPWPRPPPSRVSISIEHHIFHHFSRRSKIGTGNDSRSGWNEIGFETQLFRNFFSGVKCFFCLPDKKLLEDCKNHVMITKLQRFGESSLGTATQIHLHSAHRRCGDMQCARWRSLNQA